ncbi:hypothetical protein K438DRAFT_1771452 [Mycena galopus ATCC 62051]|nr:hypothetical protein K438DRAFT_1771452 [Mycena galopus ATCC 62051]
MMGKKTAVPAHELSPAALVLSSRQQCRSTPFSTGIQNRAGLRSVCEANQEEESPNRDIPFLSGPGPIEMALKGSTWGRGAGRREGERKLGTWPQAPETGLQALQTGPRASERARERQILELISL